MSVTGLGQQKLKPYHKKKYKAILFNFDCRINFVRHDGQGFLTSEVLDSYLAD